MANQNTNTGDSATEVQAGTTPTIPATAEDFTSATRREYGQYVAKEQIFHGNALAYNPGDPVPASNVKLHKYDEQGVVVKTGSKAHQDLLRSLGQPVPES